MGQHQEREQIREAALKAQHDAQEKRVTQVVEDTKKSYEAVKELIENPVAWKALLHLRAKIRRIRQGWLDKQLSTNVERNGKIEIITHQEKDVLLGQYNSCLLLFDILHNIKEIHKNMVPGKEADYIREKLFRNPHAQQQPQ